MPLGEVLFEFLGHIILEPILKLLFVENFRFVGAMMRLFCDWKNRNLEETLKMPGNIRRGILFYIILGMLIFGIYWINVSEIFGSPKAPKGIGNHRIDSVVVFKSIRKMLLFSNSEYVTEFHVSLGDNPVGHKQFEGDEKTPEGLYLIDYKNPMSSYTKSLHINYPNKKDKAFARSRNKSPGGEIFIHGSPKGYENNDAQKLAECDWTDGCIAVQDSIIRKLFQNIKIPCPILIQP